MATDSPKLQRIGLIAAKVETTTGTAISVSASDAQLIVLNPTMTPDESFNEVMLPADLGQRKGTAGAKGGSCEFDVELTGNGATGVPQWASTLLPACDWVNSAGTFSPTRDATTLTIAYYEDGIKRILSGARGTFTITLATGKPGIVHFRFIGKYQDHADAAILAPTFPTVLAPIFAGSTVTLGSFTPRLSQITLDAGNELVLREDQSDVTAYHAACIVSRNTRGTADPETSTVAIKDFWADYKAGTEVAVSIAVGSLANNTITIAGAAVQVRRIERGYRNKIMVDSLNFQFNGSTSATIAFS